MIKIQNILKRKSSIVAGVGLVMVIGYIFSGTSGKSIGPGCDGVEVVKRDDVDNAIGTTMYVTLRNHNDISKIVHIRISPEYSHERNYYVKLAAKDVVKQKTITETTRENLEKLAYNIVSCE